MIVLVVGSGCATAQQPSPAQARQPTPGSVTRDNPGGDAKNPIDAALERLLSEPVGRKVDRWRTLGTNFPDPENWKRVRFWGYPTRAGFRYGKDPHIAVSMVSYTKAAGDDSPGACMRTFVDKAQETADLFDVAVGDVHREARTHKRGPERVDWQSAAADWEIEKKRRLEERKKRLAELREKKLERLKLIRERIAARRLAQRQKAAANAAKNGQPAPPPADARASKVIPPTRATPPPAPEAPTPNDTQSDAEAKPGEAESKPARPRMNRRPLLSMKKIETKRPSRAPQEGEANKRREAQNEHLRELRGRQAAQPHRRVPIPKDLPASHMAVVRTSGKFNTLFKRDQYEVAIVAYESWPGTCLVQGFAVRVGTDVMLARRVVTRWLDEAAPALVWATWLREAPAFEDR